MSDLEDLTPVERELREGRPAPSGSFLDALVSRVSASAAVTPARRSAWHLRLALVATVIAVAAFGAIGGFGAVSSAAQNASRQATDVVTRHHDGGNRGKHGDDGNHGQDGNQGQGEGDDAICEDHHRPRHVRHSEARRLVASHHAEYGPCPVP
jgi:hypothetical protein